MSNFKGNQDGVGTGGELTQNQETFVQNLGALADTAANEGVGITSGAPVKKVLNPTIKQLTSYAAGTVYSLTNAAAKVVFGTTSPAIVINEAGTYVIFARCRVDYTAATFAAVRTVSAKLRRTNNTAADLTGAATSLLTQIITLLSFTAGYMVLPPVIYTTVNVNDAIELQALVNTVPTAGTIDITEAEIIAIRIA